LPALDDIKSSVKGIYHNSKFLSSTSELPSGAPFGILLDRTNFYAEQGGQENDTGVIAIDGKAEFKVEDVQVYNGYVLHIGQMEEGEIKVGDEVICTYDEVSHVPSRASSLVADWTQLTTSYADGLSATTIPEHTSSTSHCVKS
jgi:alanyl-tRNA synthetase